MSRIYGLHTGRNDMAKRITRSYFYYKNTMDNYNVDKSTQQQQEEISPTCLLISALIIVPIWFYCCIL